MTGETKKLPLVRRSNLIMPVNRTKFVEKAWQRGADAITLDLEDSIAEDQKDHARTYVKGAIQMAGQGGSDIIVRINNRSDRLRGDLESCVFPGLSGVAIPKVESIARLQEIESIISELEQVRGIPTNTIKTTLSFETAYGFVHMNEILAAGTRTEMIGLGTEDFTNDLGIELKDPEVLLYPKFYAVIAARAFRVQPRGLIGSIANYKDLDGFYAVAHKSYQYGFRGSSCIHPDQVAVLNRAFSPEPEDVAHAKAVVETYEAGIRQGLGAVSLNGKMIDLPVVERAQKVLDMNNAIRVIEERKKTCVAKAMEHEGGRTS